MFPMVARVSPEQVIKKARPCGVTPLPALTKLAVDATSASVPEGRHTVIEATPETGSAVLGSRM